MAESYPFKKKQPIDNVVWRKASDLHANDYNPNHVAPPELALIKTSLLEDGWCAPILIRDDLEIVDGFHRWTVASKDAQVSAMTNGLVPTVVVNVDKAHQMMTTVRMNRARGVHGVLPMSQLVRYLINEEHRTVSEVCELLGMEYEEYDRLYDIRGMPKRLGANKDFNEGWVPSRKATKQR